jgi:hypothetical protein
MLESYRQEILVNLIAFKNNSKKTKAAKCQSLSLLTRSKHAGKVLQKEKTAIL